ncbi:chitin deacetylase [Mortierella hygrophila]|uniref:Chitin deacetylase n=1 Tax=Mortierella hygrophila TaxID=979708 RepID=A0A9P6K8I2_9FUNG|nr:chitin deacetylase [Mortierella hygrophila]
MLRKYLLAAAAIAACTFIPSSLASPIPAPAPSLPAELQALNKRASATVIRACTVPGTFAVTFDDGPGIETPALLDYLDIKQIKVTFFVNGLNYNDINDPVIAATIKRAYAAGHQIASHTWSHADISLGTTDIASEMNKLDVALKALIGKRPVYMRPPYGNTSPAALEYLGSNGYKVINWNVDTDDWMHPTNFKLNFQAYKNALQGDTTGKSFISLQHDAEPMTAQVFSKLAIEYVLAKGFKVVPAGSCLGDNDNWYRD